MSTLHRLRRQGAGLLGRLTLLWFALSLTAAIAAPIVHPPVLERVCSSAGTARVVAQTGDGAPATGTAHLDCPLCLPTGAPPPVALDARPALPRPSSRALPAVAASPIVAATDAAPPPARGPPLG